MDDPCAMKVALVTSYMPPHLGGLEQIAESIFTGYVSRGVETRWVASRIPADAPPREDHRVRVPCFNLAEDWLGVPVPIWGPTGWTEVARAVRWADAVHVLECLYLSSALATALARRHGKPVVVSQNIGFVEYGFPPLNWIERAAYATLGRAVLRRASHVVLATPAAVAHAGVLFPGGLRRASVFPIGIDTARFRPPAAGEAAAARVAVGLPPAGPLVLFAGRLVRKKGLPVVLDVARRLPGVRFVVAGDGPLRTLLSAAPANVVWHRRVPAGRMPEYYRAADCVLLPSHGEGLPLVVQEAMACGRPVVVAADEPYAQALVPAGVCAAAERTPAAMAERVGEVLAGRDPSLGRRARAHAEAHWALGTMVARYVALLEALL
jgi:glycosyltransferase involved in cell wall biosynthesis